MSTTNDEGKTFRLSLEATRAVREIMKRGNFATPQEAFRRSIADERFLQREQNTGHKVILRKQ
jgi:hypothetical protein